MPIQKIGPRSPAPLRETVAGEVHFALDKTTIISASAGILDRVAAALRNNPRAGVQLIGHADVRASVDYNHRLAERRVQAVRGYLVAAGVDAARISTEARGAQALKSPGNTIGDHAQNRRVELVYTGMQDVQIVFPQVDLQPEK